MSAPLAPTAEDDAEPSYIEQLAEIARTAKHGDTREERELAATLFAWTTLRLFGTRHPESAPAKETLVEIAGTGTPAAQMLNAWLALREQERAEFHERVARRAPLIPPPDRKSARPGVNALGDPIASTAEDLHNFWQWFGDSCTVDEQGRPFVMYLGGATSLGPLVELNGPGVGYCFGSLPSAERNALGLSADHACPPLVTAAYLRLCNPVIINRGLFPDGTRYRRDLPEADKFAIMQRAKAAGQDGAILSYDGVFLRGLVFDARQVKATANSGAFDPRSRDIFA